MMGDVMLLGSLRMPMPDDPKEMSSLEWLQFKCRALQAADRIENDADEIERLRNEAADTIEQQAAEIERLRRAVAEAACYLSPAGCKAMNDAYKASDSRAKQND